jgi:hypothetical protein
MNNTYADVTTLRNTPKQAAAELNREVKARKAEQLASEKLRRAELKANKAIAKVLYETHGAAMIEEYATEYFTKKMAKENLHFMKTWEPEKFIRLANNFAQEQL